MRAWRRVVRMGAVLGLVVAGAACLPAPGSGYRLVRLPTAGGEAERSYALAINDRGQILGQTDEGLILWTDGEPTMLGSSTNNAFLNERGDVVAGGPGHTTIWREGTPTTITTPTPAWPEALDEEGRVLLAPSLRDSSQPFYIWDDGQLEVLDGLSTLGAVVTVADMEGGKVVGEVRDSLYSWPTFAFVWEDGHVTDLGSLGAGRTVARAVNELGQVAGESDVPTGYRHAYLWQDGHMTDIGSLPGSDSSTFEGLSDAGHVVGRSVTATGESHAYRWHEGAMVDLGTLGGDFSSSADVNDRGEVVGWSTVSRTGNDPSHAFIWRFGRIHDLGGLAGRSASATAVNNRGDVAGDAYTPDEVSHAVLWARGQPPR